MRSGLPSGSTCTAMPTRNRRVRAAMKLARARGADWIERLPLKWISPSQTPSRPPASAASARSIVSRSVAPSLTPRRRSSRKIPKCMGCPVPPPAHLAPEGFRRQVTPVRDRRATPPPRWAGAGARSGGGGVLGLGEEDRELAPVGPVGLDEPVEERLLRPETAVLPEVLA